MLSEVYSSLKPLFILSSLTGLFFIKIDFQALKIVTPFWNRLIIIFVVLIQIFGNSFYIHNELMTELLFTKVSKIGTPILMLSDYFFSITAMLWIFTKREQILKILINLSEIDDNLRDFGIKIDYKKEQRKLSIVIGFLMIIFVSSTIITTLLSSQLLNGINLGVFLPILSFMIFVIGLTLLAQYIIIATNIGMRFEMMNSCIDKSALKLPKIHLKIAECVKIYNLIYGFPMMGTFAILFIWSCMSTSTVILMPRNNIFLFLFFIIGLISAAFALCFIVRSTEKTSAAKQQAIHLLYGKMSKEPENAESIFQFIMQIRHTNVGFSCKFFEFNWNLIFNFITACVMYLIIIIQFEGSVEKKDT